MKSNVRVGLIGCGKQGAKHAAGWHSLAGVDVVLADQDEAAAAELARQTGFSYVPPEEVLTDEDITAIDICTPTPTHARFIMEALRNDKSFFCEKPLCSNLREARQIEQALESGANTGMIGYLYRFAPAFEAAKQLLPPPDSDDPSPVLGNLVHATMRLGGRGSHQAWKHRRATGGGAVNEMLVHMLDLAIWFFGRVEQVDVLEHALLRPTREIDGEVIQVDAEDYVVVSLEMVNGLRVLIQADFVTPAFSQLVEIQGTEGSFRGSIQGERVTQVYTTLNSDLYPKGTHDVETPYVDLFERQLSAFVKAVQAGRQPTRGSVSDSVHLVQIMNRIHEVVDHG